MTRSRPQCYARLVVLPHTLLKVSHPLQHDELHPIEVIGCVQQPRVIQRLKQPIQYELPLMHLGMSNKHVAHGQESVAPRNMPPTFGPRTTCIRTNKDTYK